MRFYFYFNYSLKQMMQVKNFRLEIALHTFKHSPHTDEEHVVRYLNPLETKKQVSDDESCSVSRRKMVCACASTRQRSCSLFPYYLLDGMTINSPAHHNNCNSFWIRLQFGKKYNLI